MYIVRGDDHTWNLYIMPIHGHCTLMFLGLLYVYLQSYAEIDHFFVLMSGWFFHLGLHYSTSWMDYIMYFSHHVTPPTSHIRGYLLQLILPHLENHTCMAFPYPFADSLDPMELFYTFDFSKIIPKNMLNLLYATFKPFLMYIRRFDP